tara:strand:- start:7957 stop:9582 length:1626 start_codon:yes stop_codon:yes gene_type:complete
MQDPVKKAQEKRRAEREQLQRARERVRAAKDARRADMEKERKARDAKNKAEREKDTKDEAVASIKDKPLVDPRDKAELYKLVTLALKQTPGSPKQKATIKKINVLRKKNGMKPLKEEGLSNSFLALAKMGKGAVKNTSVYGRKKRRESTDESLWANIHKKRQRIKRGSGERMRKKGEKGAPTPAQMKRAKNEASVKDFNSTFKGSKSEFERLKKDLAKNNMKVKIIKKYPDGQIDFFVQAKNPRFVKKIQKDIEKKYDASLSTVPESVNEDAKMAKLSDDKLRALLKKLQDFRKKEPKAPSTQFFIKRVEKEMKKRNLTEELMVNEKSKKRFVKNIKSIKKNARSLPLSRDYILNTDNLDKLTPMNNQMARAKLSTNYDHPKYGSGTEIETKKGAVLIKPEVAELYMKSRDRLPGPIQKNMDKMALRSPDGLFTVLQAALNDLQTGMIESMEKIMKEEVLVEADSLYLIYKDKMKAKKVAAHIKARHKKFDVNLAPMDARNMGITIFGKGAEKVKADVTKKYGKPDDFMMEDFSDTSIEEV